ncbi:MAG: 4Fe-4S binding protein [Burkholderiales bacterium]|nr:4Fe-4S binding protein [Burkholderiales bacterium]
MYFLSPLARYFLCLFFTLSVFPLSAGELLKEDIAKIFADTFIVGEMQPGMPLYPLFIKNPELPDAKPEHKGYVFESVDFEPVRGYGGKPINILVAMDTEGRFIKALLISHREPIFRSDAGIAKLSTFTKQYEGLTVKHRIEIFGYLATARRDDQYAALFGVQAGTVTAKAIDRTIVTSAASVALAHVEASAMGQIAGSSASSSVKRQSEDDSYKPLMWEDLLSRGMVSSMSITRGEIEKLFVGTRAAGADKLAATKPDEVALTFHAALVSLPSIGRNLLDDDGWRLLGANRRLSQALMVTETGPLYKMNYESQRVVEDIPFVVSQAGKELKLRPMAYDKGLKVPGYPDKTGAYFYVIDTATPLDPTQGFEVQLKYGRRFGNFPNQVESRLIDVPYSYHGIRAQWHALLDTDVSSYEWAEVWRERSGDIAVLLLGLIVLSSGLFLQKRLSAKSTRLKVLRSVYLLFTVGFIGWYAQGQLSIVNITASIEALVAGGDLSFFMNDPMTVILWLFVAVTLLVWGRGTFCGWLCPFGALQELISLLANAVGVRQRRLKTALDAKLKWIKYGVLAVVVGSLYASPSFAELALEVEPFKTSISMYFDRDWPYVAWAAFCLGLSVVVYRGYCRYICPLGAALAVVNVLQRWSWIPRRAACGTPCQTCRHRCEYQAIDKSGDIDYAECFQCLDCVSIYQDDQKCLPLIQHRKIGGRFIPVQQKVSA